MVVWEGVGVGWRVPQSPRCVQSPPASNAIGFRLHGRGLKGLKVYGGRRGRGCGAKRAANHRSAFRWSDVAVVVLVWPRCAIRPLHSVSLLSPFSFSFSLSLSPFRSVRLSVCLSIRASRSLVHSFAFSASLSPRNLPPSLRFLCLSVFLAEYQIPAIW